MMLRILPRVFAPLLLCLLCGFVFLTSCETSETPRSAASAEEPAAEAERARGKANTAMGLYYDVLHGKAETSRLAEARQALEEARALQPQNPRIEKDYVQVLLAMGETGQAIEISEALLEEDESYLINHAMILDRYRSFEAARPYYEAYTNQLEARVDAQQISAERLGEGITLAIGLLLMEEDEQAYDLIDTLQQRHPSARIWGDYLHLQRREFSKEDYLHDIYPEVE
ncbi:MAG: tetratricopeptide repeat protein [Cyclonatronaceae bacterium]